MIAQIIMEEIFDMMKIEALVKFLGLHFKYYLWRDELNPPFCYQFINFYLQSPLF